MVLSDLEQMLNQNFRGGNPNFPQRPVSRPMNSASQHGQAAIAEKEAAPIRLDRVGPATDRRRDRGESE
jgi:hypothetical protein